jgi:hypothetical protein
VQEPPRDAFVEASFKSLESMLRQAALDGKFVPDPLVGWSHVPSKMDFERVFDHLTS